VSHSEFPLAKIPFEFLHLTPPASFEEYSRQYIQHLMENYPSWWRQRGRRIKFGRYRYYAELIIGVNGPQSVSAYPHMVSRLVRDFGPLLYCVTGCSSGDFQQALETQNETLGHVLEQMWFIAVQYVLQGIVRGEDLPFQLFSRVLLETLPPSMAWQYLTGREQVERLDTRVYRATILMERVVRYQLLADMAGLVIDDYMNAIAKNLPFKRGLERRSIIAELNGRIERYRPSTNK